MLQEILTQLQDTNTKLVAVSKTKPPEQILKIYDQGQRIFGENRVQELVQKYEEMPKDIEWHLIGGLQTNKVKYIAPFVAMIHSIDSFKLLKEVNKQARKNDRVIKVLLQFKIAQEDTKAGFDLSTAKEILDSEAFTNLENIEICGVMGMATFTDDEAQVRGEFQRLMQIYNSLKESYFSEATRFSERSMGMSGDYAVAVEERSTMVRIGSLLFGVRN